MKRRRGFTLIELLFTIAVIATLAAILFPVFARARESARKHTCLSNQVNIGFALHMYAADYGGRFPPTEDDPSPLWRRYLRHANVFFCPSSSEQTGVPVGAPANAKLSNVPKPLYPEDAKSAAQLRTTYYYRAGHRPYEAPSAPILSDHELTHNEHANVLYTDGHAASLEETAWRAAGFRPLKEIWPPPGQGPPGGGPPGMPGGGPPGMPGMGGPGGGTP